MNFCALWVNKRTSAKQQQKKRIKRSNTLSNKHVRKSKYCMRNCMKLWLIFDWDTFSCTHRHSTHIYYKYSCTSSLYLSFSLFFFWVLYFHFCRFSVLSGHTWDIFVHWQSFSFTKRIHHCDVVKDPSIFFLRLFLPVLLWPKSDAILNQIETCDKCTNQRSSQQRRNKHTYEWEGETERERETKRGIRIAS